MTMLEPKILILFLPLLLLVEANLQNGPFHRSQPALIQSPTFSSSSPAHRQGPKPSQSKSHHYVYRDGRDAESSYRSTLRPPNPTVPPTTSTNSNEPLQVQTSKTSTTLRPVHIRLAGHHNPAPVTHLPEETSRFVVITTPKPSLFDKPQPVYADKKRTDTSPYYVSKDASPWILPNSSESILRTSQSNSPQPDRVRSDNFRFQTQTTVTSIPTEKSYVQIDTVDSARHLNTFSTDTSVEVETRKPSLSITPHSEYEDYSQMFTSPNFNANPWILSKHSLNSSVEILRESQPKTQPPMYVDKSQRGAGPYLRPQRSSNPWEPQAFSKEHRNLNTYPSQSGPAYNTAPPTTPDVHRFICPQPNGYFKQTDQCGEYIECKNYVPLTLTCPIGLHFNTNVHWTAYPCDHPSKVQCTKEPTTEPQPNVVTAPRLINEHPDYMCHQAHGYFKFTYDCREYIECKNYVPRMFRCPTGLHFKRFAQWAEYPCDHPLKVQCNSDEVTTTQPPPPPPTTRLLPPPTTRPPPPPPTTRPPPPPTTRQPPPPTTRRPPPPTTRRPPPPSTRRPPPPTTRRPPPPPPLRSTTRLPPPPPPTTTRPPPPPTTRKPLPPPTTTSLPPPTTTTRRPPPPTRPPPAVTTPVPNHIICPKPHGYFSYSDECGEYVECKNYIPLMFSCPVGLHFNPVVEWTGYPCDHPSKMQCNKETGVKKPATYYTTRDVAVTLQTSAETAYSPRLSTPATVNYPPEHPSRHVDDFYCDVPNAFFSVAAKCNVYIECQSYTAVQHYCPVGLYFNPTVQWPSFPCDYPSNVKCDAEPIIQDHNKPITQRRTVVTSRSVITDQTHRSTAVTSWTQRPTTKTPWTQRPTTKTPWTQRPTTKTPWTQRPTTKTPRTERSTTVTHWTQQPTTVTPWTRRPAGVAPRIQQPSTETPWTERSTTEHPWTERSTKVTPWTQRPAITSPRYSTTVKPYTPRFLNNPTITPLTSNQLFDYRCPESNGFYAVSSQCDVYVECTSDIAIQHSCPDGLHFNRNAEWPDYPCGYPSEVKCSSGDVVQEPIPTEQCPHRDGFFPANSGDCGMYIVCHDGIAVLEHCPPGLVFNFEKDVCDWPVNVPECNQPRALEGFACPATLAGEDDILIRKYRYGRSCKEFIACQEKQPRLLSCDAELYFDEKTESCVNSALVVDCDAQ